jgi:hypothetical protein
MVDPTQAGGPSPCHVSVLASGEEPNGLLTFFFFSLMFGALDRLVTPKAVLREK